MFTRYAVVRVGCFLAVMLVSTLPAFAQLTLVETTPADGTVQVGTAGTVTFTFNEAIDTSVGFDVSDGFYLGVAVYPDPGGPLDIRISPDGRSVSMDFNFEEDTQFVALLSGATGLSGASLVRPYVINFTTGASLPTATVSGTVDFPGGDPTGAVVYLFERLVEGSFIGEGDDIRSLGVVTGPSGVYTAPYLPAGDYEIGAFIDANGDGTVDDPFNDPVGFHDAGGDNLIDILQISDGAAVTGIDISIRLPSFLTARTPFDQAQQFAEQWQADAAVGLTFSEITPEGRSDVWAYVFGSPSTTEALGVLTVNGQYAVGAFIPDAEDDFFSDFMALPDAWIDSDQAATVAADNGGADFLADNPGAEITAFLLHLDLSFFSGKRSECTGGRFLKTCLTAPPLGTESLAFGAAARPVWLVLYEEDFAFFVVAIDPVSGEVIPVGGGGEYSPTVASFNTGVADAPAAAWAADARLVGVGMGSNEGIAVDGTTPVWAFSYYAPSLDQVHTFAVAEGTVVSERDDNKDNFHTLEALPDGWIDSPVATAIAEANSNSFRSQHADAVVSALLSHNLFAPNPERAVWKFVYHSAADEALAEVLVDALTGDVVRVGNEDPAAVPGRMTLDANYPNPFNPETTITYALSEPGEVVLTVYTLLGQPVRTLVQARQPVGSYEVRWDGRDAAGRAVASGAYFYRLQRGSMALTRRMLLLR